ncbi:MAG: phage major capsid protein [Gammaproteobacteria bacterium]|nr:phage major capsid protein [Gammaproteobacteria bacterium]
MNRTRTETLSTLNIATADFMEDVVSAINNDNFVSKRLLKKAKPFSGGEKVDAPLKYGRENTQTMDEFGQYNFQPIDILDSAFYEIKHVHGDMVLSQKQVDAQNRGKAKLIGLSRLRAENMSESMRNQFSELLFTSVASLETTDPDSLIKICATRNNIVGEINAATETRFDWNPKLLDYTAVDPSFDNLVDPTSAYYVETLLQKIVGPLTVGTDKPTIALCNQAFWDAYERVLRADKRFDSKYYVADGGFDTLKFRSMMIHVDQHVPGGKLNQVSNNEAAFIVLNEKYMGYRYAPEVNMDWTEWFKLQNQPVYASYLDWMGAFICNRRDRQGAITGLPTDYQAHGSW